ncbi:MAG: tetratricopeptide repeat protein [Planctomycetota bacterium]
MVSSQRHRAIQGIFGLAGACLLAGCGSLGGNVANSSGMGFYERGNYSAAAQEFQLALQNDPGNPDYMANLAKVKMKQGDAHGAEQLYRQALTAAPSHQPSYHGLSELMLTQGRSNEAQAMLTTWAGAQPYSPEPHIELAWLQRQTGQSAGAAQSLQRALQINPNHAVAMAHLGEYYEGAGRPDQAATMYQQSLQADWNQPDVHSRLAGVSQSAGTANPMVATAMARGVHPWDLPRQGSAFGPPSQGAQMARMQNQMQMQAQLRNQFVQHPQMPGFGTTPQIASLPWQSGSMSGSGMPAGSYFSSPAVNGPGSPMNFGPGGGWTVSGSPQPFEIPGGSAATVMGPATGSGPVPDPAFSTGSGSGAGPAPSGPVASGVPISTISLNAQAATAGLSSGSESPLVEAF